jgi:hypothetical protein
MCLEFWRKFSPDYDEGRLKEFDAPFLNVVFWSFQWCILTGKVAIVLVKDKAPNKEIKADSYLLSALIS